MKVPSWEFESPLRHHKKINGLEEKVFLLTRFSFSPHSYSPPLCPHPWKFVKISWGTHMPLPPLSVGETLRACGPSFPCKAPPGHSYRMPWGSFFVLSVSLSFQTSPFLKKNTPPSRVHGRRAKPRALVFVAMCHSSKGACVMQVRGRRGWFPRPDEPAARSITSDKGNGLRKAKA